MQLEEWVELIKNVLGSSAFKTVAAAALRSLYQAPVVITDGTGDGGVDGWIEFRGSRVPVQFHSGRATEWYVKLEEDLSKPAVQAAAARRLLFVCAQTPTRDSVLRRTAEFEQAYNIVVEVIDARTIASAALSDPTVLAPLRNFLPRTPPNVANATQPSASDDVRLAFVFFHEASADFRAEIARSALKTALVRAKESLSEERLLDDALSLVGGDEHQRGIFRRQLATLIVEGCATIDADRVAPVDTLVQQVTGEWNAGLLAEQELRKACITALDGRVHSEDRRREAIDAIFDDLGLLLRRSIVERLAGGEREELARRLNAMERRLSDMLKPSGGSVQDALETIIEVVRRSVYGRALASAELFRQMTKRPLGELARALTGRERLKVALDTSVAMPMLCAKLDRTANGWVTSEIAVELHQLLLTRGIQVVVPDLYLEEMASHLLKAADRYVTLTGESGLERSENFFVAHYHAVAIAQNERPTASGFREFLDDLGLPSSWEREDRLVARRKVQRAQTELLNRYGIDVARVTITDALPLKDEPERIETVLDHDRRVAAWLDAGAPPLPRSGLEGLVLCSQDRWLVRAVADRDWLAVDPATLADLLPMVRPTTDLTPLISLRELAQQAGERVLQRAAEVWDELAKLEGDRFTDRALLRRAREFKDAWVAREQSLGRSFATEWQRFKQT